MPTPNQAHRSRAHKMRKLRAEGHKLSAADEAWLVTYEAGQTIARAKREQSPNAPTLPAPLAQETERTIENVAASEFTWSPVTLPAPPPPPETPAEGGTPATLPSPGDAPRPAAGAPLVDEPAAAAPVGDPVAAQQFAMFITFLAGFGFDAARELMGTMPLPAPLRMMLASNKAKEEVLEPIATAAERLAIKRGFRSVPLADEFTVVAAVVGSAALVYANEKRKLTEAEPAPVVAPSAAPGAPPRTASAIDALFTEGA